MKTLVFVALGLLLATFLFVWLIGRLRYEITPQHVKICLFGICLRRMRLSNIASVSKRRIDGWAENWWSTLRPNHRILVLRKKRGLFRNLVVTPRNRYVFKADLEQAIQASETTAPSPEPPVRT
jgi:hypothetical protein